MGCDGLGRQGEQGTLTQNSFQESDLSGTKDSLATSNPVCRIGLPQETSNAYHASPSEVRFYTTDSRGISARSVCL